MGMLRASFGQVTALRKWEMGKKSPMDKTIALLGNPNVGKSTLFNAMTGMRQHTGNWPGKTVSVVQGRCRTAKGSYILVDLPGTYSLMAGAAEEEIAGDFLCSGDCHGAVVVCDGACLSRGLRLALQVMEVCPLTMLCVNMLDEADKKGISIDLEQLSVLLGIPVVGVTAHSKKSLPPLYAAMDSLFLGGKPPVRHFVPPYPKVLTEALDTLLPVLTERCAPREDNCRAVQSGENRPFGVSSYNSHSAEGEGNVSPDKNVSRSENIGQVSPRWAALRLLEGGALATERICRAFGVSIEDDIPLKTALGQIKQNLSQAGISREKLKDMVTASLVLAAERLAETVTVQKRHRQDALDRRLDRILTSKTWGYPVMAMLLAVILWLTIVGANVPSQLLAEWLFSLEDRLSAAVMGLGVPLWMHDCLVLGVYRTLAWVVSVMLPPMAIFFPLFTCLEDGGFLPRIAYNLDKPFQRCGACGKQALSMCMGFGCNAVGVVSCRIIDTPRERLLAILTNSFVPCNGRFPTLITLITLFFIGSAGAVASGILSALLLSGVLLLGVGATFLVTRFLSDTVLPGEPGMFVLELPAYRCPQIGDILLRSLLDRTLRVLGRAVLASAPAGAVIWVMANVTVGDMTLLNWCAGFLDPLGRFMGLDGVILLAFLLGLPANEIVMPVLMMAYLSQGSLLEVESLDSIARLLAANGWDVGTALCFIVFSLFHWPCATTLMTIRGETGSLKWTLLAAALPTTLGIVLCAVLNGLFTFLG